MVAPVAVVVVVVGERKRESCKKEEEEERLVVEECRHISFVIKFSWGFLVTLYLAL